MQLPALPLDALVARLRGLDTLLARASAGDGADTVAATVIGRAPDGRLIVAAGSRAVALRHEADAAPGSTVRVPARLLAEGSPEAVAPDGGGAREPAAAAPRLTSAARLLASLPPAPEAVVRSAQALAPAPGRPEHVAHGLRDAIAASGVFYESHLAEWVRGERPLVALAREPQAAWGRPGGSDASAAAAAQPRASAEPAPERLPEPAASAGAPGAAPALPDLPAPARELIAHQLAVHDARAVVWEGDAWPGQHARVAVEEEPGGAADAAGTRSWRVTIATELPRLGRVEAEIRLADGRAGVALAAADAEAARLLAADGPSLAAALGAAGVPLAAVTVKHHA